ncbi:MAG: hypothetical protein DRR19_10860 [Candidatus Parabeggiatoa sp. nov. 1]|nr:MAG: hypothetical protein DRR19_10860 [Gammaproteobacteria bacterium]
MHLVLLKTSGNQSYVFATNRLRENVGASELTYQVGTQFVLEAVKKQGGPHLWSNEPKILRENIRDKQQHIESSETPIEVIVATAGKALLLVKDEKVGRDIISDVTRNALQKAPSLDICGVISESFDWNNDKIQFQLKGIHKTFDEVRSRYPHSLTRFPCLPITALCASSGLPAYTMVKDGGTEMGEAETWHETSRVSYSKQEAAEAWKARIGKLTGSKRLVVNSISELEKYFGTVPWFAVVHADGNGLGKILGDFDKHIGCKEELPAFNRTYVDKLRLFSLALEEASESAFCNALKELEKFKAVKEKTLPIVPLVLGGDSLTVICDGRYALEFTRLFLNEFEEQTANNKIYDGIIPEIAKHAFNCQRLSACAGVAIIKPHFPFHNGYRLAEELIKEAKIVTKQVQCQDKTPYPCSAMDFHVASDVSVSRLSEIREQLKVDKNRQEGHQTRLTAKPYVVTAEEKLPKADIIDLSWAKQHHVTGLLARIQTLLVIDDESRRQLPHSQVHSLREGLFLGRDEANGRLNLMLKRYRDFGKFLEVSPEDDNIKVEGIFRFHTDKQESYWETRFLDALEAVDFWKEYYRGNT